MATKKTNDSDDRDNNDPQPNKTWLERNMWLIALFFALFLVRMCGELSR